MTKPKNHHYVPQAYLKRFSSNGTQIHVFDKFNQRNFVSNVKNVASETYFYDVNQDQISEILQRIENHKSEFTSDELQEFVESVKDLGTLEQRLSQVEGRFDVVIESVIESVQKKATWFRTSPAIKSIKLDDKKNSIPVVERLLSSDKVEESYKEDLALLIALQIVRTRDHRDSITEFIEKSTKAISQLVLAIQGIDVSNLEINTKIGSEQAQMLHLAQMLDSSVIFEIADALLSHIWTFVVNDTTQPLFTSDSPVTLVPNKFSPHRHYTGYASEGIEIRMPLTPFCAVVLYERNHFSTLQPIEGKVIPLSEENVTYHNSIQINQSYRQVYSPNDNFELAELTCREHPEVCNPERSRWGIR